MVGDTRPLTSPMPAEAAAIGQGVVDQLKPMLDRAFDRVAALPGNAAERENDALSIVATVGSFVVQQLTGHLMLRKHAEFDVAFSIAMHEVHHRAAAELLAVVGRKGRGE